MKKCPFCAEEIKEEAIKCRFCGEMLDGGKAGSKKETLEDLVKKARKSGDAPTANRGCLLAIVLIGLLFMSCSMLMKDSSGGASAPPAPMQSPAEQKKLRAAVQDLLNARVVMKVECSSVYVNPLAWHSSTFDQKKTMGYVLAHYCGGPTGPYHVTIKDNNSGKDLAKWSQAWGFKVY